MGMLVNGQWTSEDRRIQNASGEFVRPVSPFRSWIGEPETPAVAGRYHLFVNKGCPWAFRSLLYRALKRLEQVISVSFTEPAAGSEGWTFGDDPEPIVGARHMHDVYSAAAPDFTGRATVPVLWDLERQTIVNNESADIIRMFNSAFDALPGVRAVDFYPAALATEIDALNAVIYDNVNNGVYRCGFAQSQSAYDSAVELLFATLEDLDQRLATRRFLFGAEPLETDWRLFATLVRFDLAYHGQFRCNLRQLGDFPNLWPYTRDLYQWPGVADTVDVAAIKGIYYGGRPPRIIPAGPVIDFEAGHNRDRLAA